MIKFFVSRLEKEDITLEDSEPAEILELNDGEYRAIAPVSYKLTGKLVSGGILVSGKCSTKISGSCGICLDDVQKTISVDDLEMFFEISPDQEECDITEDIRTEILLEMPMNLRCKDDCLGLCPVCGNNRNHKECDCKQPGTGSMAWRALDELNL
jgi:uncharacterized protein